MIAPTRPARRGSRSASCGTCWTPSSATDLLAVAVKDSGSIHGGNYAMATRPITVTTGTNPKVVAISPAQVEVAVGGSTTLTATLQNTTGPVTWTSSNPSVASVSSPAGLTALVNGLAQGNATMVAQAAAEERGARALP